MSDPQSAFVEAWQRTWCGEGEPSGTAAVLDETPAYPLGRTVPMPEEAGYPTGAIGFRLLGLTAGGLDRLAPQGCRIERDAKGGGTLHLVLEKVRVAGRCSIDAKPDPVVTLDVAGSLRELPGEPVEAGSDPTPGTDPDPTTEAWLDQARAQRPQLAQSTNGTAMLTTYYANNDTYADLFENSGAVRAQWGAGGITEAMASDTSDALNNSTAINSNTYSNGQSYNANAFGQQANIALGCVKMASNYPEGSAGYTRWMQAATDAASFSSTVQQQTGNTTSSTTAMTGSEVYTTVGNTDPAAVVRHTYEQVKAAFDMRQLPGGAASGSEAGGPVLDEKTRARLRALWEAMEREDAENAAVVGAPLYTGGCGAELPGVAVSLAWRIKRGKVHVAETAVTLPAFAFDIEDSGWAGAAADLARTRLQSLRFLHSMVHDAVVEGIRRAVEPRAARALAALSAA